MTVMKNPTDSLKEYFYKSLLIKLSTQTIDHKWGENLKVHISNHVFTDPFQIAEQTDEKQVQHFNKLMNTNWTIIKWRMVKSSDSQLHINEENRDEFVSDAFSQLYLQLSVPLFENLIGLLNYFIDDEKDRQSFGTINKFYELFGEEIRGLDKQNVSYQYPTILLLHNLRLFRNCITHAEGKVSDLEKKFDEYNRNINENKNGYQILKDLEHLSKIIFCYKFSRDNSKIFLDKKAFENLSDLYSQIAYVAYRCFCGKHNLTAEI